VAVHSFCSIENRTAFTAKVNSGTNIGNTTKIGVWETDWAQIASFVAAGDRFLLFYRSTGDVFTAPINSATNIGKTTQVGLWDTDWAHIGPFNNP
jgi:hypothetical protein